MGKERKVLGIGSATFNEAGSTRRNETKRTRRSEIESATEKDDFPAARCFADRFGALRALASVSRGLSMLISFVSLCFPASHVDLVGFPSGRRFPAHLALIYDGEVEIYSRFRAVANSGTFAMPRYVTAAN